MTPYRLVTTGADGLARIWDIREACLKRYGNMIGKRPEYQLKINGKSIENETQLDLESTRIINDSTVVLPPIPTREENTGDSSILSSSERQQGQRSVPLPPLLPAVPLPPLPNPDNNIQNNPDNDNDENQPGRFIANDMLDEGVKLISSLQHGASLDERALAPGTRTRRAAVKVICVARCPYGGHFATGSDDGICRVWKDEDDPIVDRIDAELSRRQLSNIYVRQTTSKYFFSN